MTLSAGVIQGLPLLDQNNEPTADHLADENARMNCVFTGNAMVSRKYGGHPYATGDDIKDGCSRYGQGYQGGADEEVVASDSCLDRKWGIHADTVHYISRPKIIEGMMVHADAGRFSMCTIPSAWNSQVNQAGYNPDSPNFWTHACIYCGYVDGTHVLANPWGGFLMYYSFDDLALRLCYLKAYPITPVAVPQKVNALITIERDSNGAVIGAHDTQNPSLRVGKGYADHILGHYVNGNIAVPEVYGLREGATCCVIRGNARVAMTYSTAKGVKEYGDDVVAVINDLYDNWQVEKKRTATPAAPTVDVAGLKTDVGNALKSLNDANDKLSGA